MKYFSIDLETTGLDPENCNIVEIGIVFDDLMNQRPLDELPRFQTYIVRDVYQGSPYALGMHSKIWNRIARLEPGYKFSTEDQVVDEMVGFMLECTPQAGHFVHGDVLGVGHINVAGKNFATFDKRFLEKLPNFNDRISIKHRTIDPAVLYYRKGDACLPATDECYRRAGTEPVVAHTAVEDAIGVIQLIRKALG